MAVNGTITPTAWTDPSIAISNTKVDDVHVNQLRTALDTLDSLKVNVQNCGFTNFCQAQCAQCSYSCQKKCS